jgi:hypothetical protein
MLLDWQFIVLVTGNSWMNRSESAPRPEYYLAGITLQETLESLLDLVKTIGCRDQLVNVPDTSQNGIHILEIDQIVMPGTH